MREWNIMPFDLLSVGHGISEVSARKLMRLGIIPDTELNDGLILIETCLAGVPNLVTSDRHLLSIDRPNLTKAPGDFDLPSVQIFHPKDLLRAA